MMSMLEWKSRKSREREGKRVKRRGKEGEGERKVRRAKLSERNGEKDGERLGE